MGFSTELQSHEAHTNLLLVQDTELQLLEVFKKCVQLRAKADREYAQALGQVACTAKKYENTLKYKSPLNAAFSAIITGAEKNAEMVKENAEKLSEQTVDKLVQLIADKKASRKYYAEERSRLDQELAKVQSELTKCSAEYRRIVVKTHQDLSKYNECLGKGKVAGKLKESKERCIQTAQQLYNAHNQYVCQLLKTNKHSRNYIHDMLPALLTYQQDWQENFVAQCHSMLVNYAALTNTCNDNFQKLQQDIDKSISFVIPNAEYADFLNRYRSEGLQVDQVEFDTQLVEGTPSCVNIESKRIAVNDLTIETLNLSRGNREVRVKFLTEQIQSKQEELSKTESTLGKESAAMDDTARNKYQDDQYRVLLLRKDVGELSSALVEEQCVLQEVTVALQPVQGHEPPIGLVLDGEVPVSVVPKESGSSNLASNISGNVRKGFNTFASALKSKTAARRGNTSIPPPVVARDFEDSKEDVNNHADNVSQHSVETSRTSAQESYQKCEVSDNADLGPCKKTSEFTERPLEEEDWFHGVLPREEVVRLLVNDGDYLVRESRNKKTNEVQYVLSVMFSDHKHFIIQGDPASGWRFEGDNFATIQELIINQHKSGQPVTKKSQAILKKAILREEWELRNDDITLGMKLGNGNFGDVYKGEYKDKKMPKAVTVAVKTCKETLSEDQKKKFLQEGRILKQYDHPNIVKFIGIAAHRQPVMIVMEFISGGSLLSYLRKLQSRIHKPPNKEFIKMCFDASSGMAYLEAKGCIHRDLAARNCLIMKECKTVKISDFGMSREQEEYTVSGGLKQIPIKWTSPEALNYGTYTTASDVWSYGILVWEIFSLGGNPYPGLTNNQARERVDEGYRMPAPDLCPDNVYKLVLMCWQQEPKDRPTFQSIYQQLQKILD